MGRAGFEPAKAEPADLQSGNLEWKPLPGSRITPGWWIPPTRIVSDRTAEGLFKQVRIKPTPQNAKGRDRVGRRAVRSALRWRLWKLTNISASHPVSILLPMIGGPDELRAAKRAIESVKTALAEEGITFDPLIPIGAMIETPSAAILIGQLAGEVDFFSVGTNDLVQYLLASDRTSGEMASFYEPPHPAALQVLASLAAAAEAGGGPICLCGEIASEPACTPLLLGPGFPNFSVSPWRLLEIKHAIRSTSLRRWPARFFH